MSRLFRCDICLCSQRTFTSFVIGRALANVNRLMNCRWIKSKLVLISGETGRSAMRWIIRPRNQSMPNFRHHSTPAAWKPICRPRRMFFCCRRIRGRAPARQSHSWRRQKVAQHRKQSATAQLGAIDEVSPSPLKIRFLASCQKKSGSWHCEINLDSSCRSFSLRVGKFLWLAKMTKKLSACYLMIYVCVCMCKPVLRNWNSIDFPEESFTKDGRKCGNRRREISGRI